MRASGVGDGAVNTTRDPNASGPMPAPLSPTHTLSSHLRVPLVLAVLLLGVLARLLEEHEPGRGGGERREG